MGYINITPEDCSGCRSCELSCSLKHYGYFDYAKSRIRILHEEEHSQITINLCIQCEERSCVHACPVDALSIDERTGCIRLDTDVCTGCRLCEKACKYNGVMWDDETGTPLICDLCDEDPECLKPCRLHKALMPSEKEIGV